MLLMTLYEDIVKEHPYARVSIFKRRFVEVTGKPLSHTTHHGPGSYKIR
jgi:hypothetical protein